MLVMVKDRLNRRWSNPVEDHLREASNSQDIGPHRRGFDINHRAASSYVDGGRCARQQRNPKSKVKSQGRDRLVESRGRRVGFVWQR